MNNLHNEICKWLGEQGLGEIIKRQKFLRAAMGRKL